MKKILAFVFLLTVHSMCFAQITNPCGGSDEDDGCYVPLDKWVMFLVAAALIFSVYKLNQKNKAIQA